MGDLRGLRVQVRKRSQALPDGARRKVGLLELDPEGHMTLCQDGCCLGGHLAQAPCGHPASIDAPVRGHTACLWL